ncbi:MAG: PfaD family polyunsaturated fatty acid/polyketide biosynthesis protein [Desulfotignum sp.]|nr:PfaD family polyunsaturated fatty acid/polyketide biosynthesis protein [Desulfotignum sp.]
MDMHNPIRSALFQISKPIFAFTDNNQLCFAHEYQAGAFCHSGNAGKTGNVPFAAFAPAVPLSALGDSSFTTRHNLAYPYVAGAMANGISSVKMVEAMADNGMVGFFGSGGLSLEKIKEAVVTLSTRSKNKPFGFNLIHSLGDPDHEMATVQLYLDHGIRLISAAAFMRITPALVYYRVKGIHQTKDGQVIAPNQVIAKVSRVEVARQFFSPPPRKLVQELLEKNLITPMEADLSQTIPMAQDLTAEADSGGHTDNRPALALLPTMMSLKHQLMAQHQYSSSLCVGLAGGIATPESAAAAFAMGAAYILTGSINQSCVEAGICQEVKQLLCQAEQADVAMAPAADMFEIGARVQVLKRGTLFALRAEKLYRLYRTHDRFEQIPKKQQHEIEDKFLQTDFETAWQSTRNFFASRQMHTQIQKAESDPKHKMALVFRSYLGQSSRWAIQGAPERKLDYQIWCGPAMGAFNQWAKNSFLTGPENRKTPDVALNLLFGACVITRAMFLKAQGVALPPAAATVYPMEKDKILALAGPA